MFELLIMFLLFEIILIENVQLETPTPIIFICLWALLIEN